MKIIQSGIYSISQNNKILYIGQSCDIRKRWIHHRHKLEKNTHSNIYLQRLYNKNNNFVFKVLEDKIARKDLTLREIYNIKKLKPLCNLVVPNATDSWVFTKERNKKISIANKGRSKSIAHRKNISLSKLGPKNPRYAKPPHNQVLLEYNGITKNLSQWAETIGMNRKSLSNRLDNGWSVKEALTIGKRKCR